MGAEPFFIPELAMGSKILRIFTGFFENSNINVLLIKPNIDEYFKISPKYLMDPFTVNVSGSVVRTKCTDYNSGYW
jgi:hypothetical protein